MTCLFFDRNVGTSLPRALRLLKLPVEVQQHEGKFAKDLADDQWLAEVGSWDWFVIGHDHMLHLRANELRAIKDYNVGVFYLWGANATRWQKMQTFARAFDKIVEAAVSTPRPFVYKVHKNGRLVQIDLP